MTGAQGSVKSMLSTMHRQSPTYEKLPIQDVSDDGESTTDDTMFRTHRDTPRSRSVGLRLILIFLAALFTISLGASGLIYAFKPTPTQSQPHSDEWVPCGHSPAEAINAGCRFEPMLSAWVPEKCSFPELIADNAGTFENWPYFHDEHTQHPIEGAELDALRVGNYTTIYSSHSTAHDLHCLYSWRKLNLAINRGSKWIDSRSLSLHHADHCAKNIAQLLEEGAGYLEIEDKRRHVTTFPLLFFSCVLLVH